VARAISGTGPQNAPGEKDRRRTAAKRAFLANMADFGNHTLASNAAGVNRDTAYRWLKEDPEFAQAYEDANESATEKLEAEAWRRAVNGNEYIRRSYWKGQVVGEDVKREYSDVLMLALLKARAPHRYREQLTADIRQVVKIVAGVDAASVLGIGPGPRALSEPDQE
jgi:hypothetical protein